MPRISWVVMNTFLRKHKSLTTFELDKIRKAEYESQHDYTIFPVFPDLRTNRIRKSGFMGIFGILRSSPIRGYPYHSCRCTGWATIETNRKNSFYEFPDEPGPEIPIYGHFWNPQVKPDPWIPLPFFVSALGEPQKSKTSYI